jgi:Fe-S-cluster containining protein
MYVLMSLPILNCDDCGACCSEIGTPPFVRHEIHNLPPQLKDEVLQWEAKEPGREDSKKPCYWWDAKTGLCEHYEHRPVVCADFQVGCESCLSYRKYHRIGEDQAATNA